MLKLKRKKNAFTLVETLIVASLFAVMVLWIIFWINRAFAFMNNTRVLVRATNFARQWVEMVYNLRDTNRRKHSWERDKYWIYAGTWDDEININYLKSWIYTIEEWTKEWGTYIYANKLLDWDDVDNFYEIDWFFSTAYSEARNKSRIKFPWIYEYYSGGTIATWNMEDLLWWSGIEFYRVLRVFWVYSKEESANPNNAVASPVKNPDKSWKPEELRFCVKVFYTYNGWHHASELCSIMTNFME